MLYISNIYVLMVNLISLTEWTPHSLSLRLGSAKLPLTSNEVKFLRDFMDKYQDLIGWYDVWESISIEFEQSENKHSKESFLEWAKTRHGMLSRQESGLANDIWS